MPKTLLFILFFGSGLTAAAAESVNLLQSTYKPTVSTKMGRIEMCSVEFSAAVSTLSKQFYSVEGSVNTAYFEGKAPGFMIKIVVNEYVDPSFVPKKLNFASMRAGQLDTLPLQMTPGGDGNSILLLANTAQTAEFFVDFPEAFYKGAWLSFSFDGRSSDYTFRLPPFGQQDIDTQQEVARCNLIGLDRLKKELRSLKN